MFEPTSSWSSVQPILQRLCKMDKLSFPEKLIDIITKLDFSNNSEIENNKIQTNELLIDPVIQDYGFHSNGYLDDNDEDSIYIKKASGKWIFDSWNDHSIDKKLRVDHEQYKALRYALTHNLTLVNGAPGTGKTHFAREYLRLMNKTENKKPIAVITYTNHALDSLLEGVIGFINNHNIIRWGGPINSENSQILSIRWRNSYLEKNIQDQRDSIATLKQQLKNLYNIRQMALLFIQKIKKDPKDFQLYQTVIFYLQNYMQIVQKFNEKYPITLSAEEEKEYKQYQNCQIDGIKIQEFPDQKNSIEFWFHGKDYYQERIKDLKKILVHNRMVFNKTHYENQFNILKQEEEDFADKLDEDNNTNNNLQKEEQNDENHLSLNNTKIITDIGNDNETKETVKEDDIKAYEEENVNEQKDENIDEKEDENIIGNDEKKKVNFDENIYGDEDIIEESKNSYFNSKIGDELPKKYLDLVLIEKSEILFSEKSSKDSMIEYLQEIYKPTTSLINKYEEKIAKLEINFANDETISAGKFLSRMSLIGMTSTVASCRKEALETAGVETLIVEEAGELTESMLCCILPKTLKRLILIGDYQQLRPKVEYELSFEPFNYHISLFEKLVIASKEKKADCLFTLSIQRRMHPQISELVRNVFYDEGDDKIDDDESTNKLSIPYGIPHRVRFIMHDYEIKSTTTRSYSNVEEAKYCASLIPFFICRGYKPNDITIIALYKGQKYEIEKQIEELFYNKDQKVDSTNLIDSFGSAESPKEFRVVVLDNFQGEENKVIIVSLTRSDKPGFIKNRNRALVTLSRAREMLVVLGNKNIFGVNCESNALWNKISCVAQKLSPYSYSSDDNAGIMVNRCQIHHNAEDKRPIVLKTPEKLIKYRFSYCKNKCNHILPCSHSCQLCCHCHSNPPEEDEHCQYCCPFRCLKRCPNNHQCRGICGKCTMRDECPPCKEIVHYTFPICKHEEDIECYLITTNKARCRAKCGKIISTCGHSCDLRCGHCGHCKCNVEIESRCTNCDRTYKYICGENSSCPYICNKILPCGHFCEQKCSHCFIIGHKEICTKKCNFVFACGHPCKCRCCDPLPNHQHLRCNEKIIVHIGSLQITRDCSEPFSYKLTPHHCEVCNKNWINDGVDSSINRCFCQCEKKCLLCGKRCRAITGEKCAFFCPHSSLKDAKEPPENCGPVFLFHDDHFLLVKDAILKVKEMYLGMMGKCELPIPIHRIKCPIDNCNNNSCLINSLLFESFNYQIENDMAKIQSIYEKEIMRNNLEIKALDKIYWYRCSECNELFYSVIEDPGNIVIKCPHCGFVKGNMFE